ncbi:MAG: glutathione S-transferase N-terminal domain-containing protein [Polyangiaceae bacterium]
MAVLIQLSYSPWSLRARWALDHHHVKYRAIEHVPMVFEPFLRASRAVLRARSSDGKATVPTLIDGREVFNDSFAIAEHAEAVGSGAPLLPADKLPQIRGWVGDIDRMLSAGRIRVLGRLAADGPALDESVPPPLRFLGAAGRPIAKSAVQFLERKYTKGAPSTGLAELEARMADVLEKLEKAVASSEYLVGPFTFADITAATAIEMVCPSDFSPLGPENRRVWTEEKLAAAYPRALAFRDRIYAAHRPS